MGVPPPCLLVLWIGGQGLLLKVLDPYLFLCCVGDGQVLLPLGSREGRVRPVGAVGPAVACRVRVGRGCAGGLVGLESPPVRMTVSGRLGRCLACQGLRRAGGDKLLCIGCPGMETGRRPQPVSVCGRAEGWGARWEALTMSWRLSGPEVGVGACGGEADGCACLVGDGGEEALDLEAAASSAILSSPAGGMSGGFKVVPEGHGGAWQRLG